MLSEKGFDRWSGDYDQSIALHAEGYPFEGYYDVLSYVQHRINVNDGVKILDLGVGTGLLTQELYKQGAQIVGVDFSQAMLDLAQQKMPKARFYHFDFQAGLPGQLQEETFDYIVSSYAFHHIDDDEKMEFISKLQRVRGDQCPLIIADVAFAAKTELDQCRAKAGRRWDADEFYIVGDEISQQLTAMQFNVKYTQISPCAGVLEIH